jgi:hypothetical protein
MCGGNNTITDFVTGVISDGQCLTRQHLSSIETQCQWMVCLPCINFALDLLVDDLVRWGGGGELSGLIMTWWQWLLKDLLLDDLDRCM